MYNSSKHCVQAIEKGPLDRGRTTIVEKLWREFFLDPSQWWDHRSEKGNTRYPDFKHKRTPKVLWLNGKLNPPWVEKRLAAMAPGTIQSNIFSWNMKLTKYNKAGNYEKTVELFQQMQREGMFPNRFSFVPVLNACARLRELELGKRIHAQIIESGCDSDMYVVTSLVGMYANCGCMDYAQKEFSKMPTHNVVSWNVMISGLVKCGQGQRALDLFQHMQMEGIAPDQVTFVVCLNACASSSALDRGRCLHEQIIQRGFESNVVVGSSLVNMYVKCGSIKDAFGVFEKIPTRDVFTWSSLIQGYVKCGQGSKALELFRQMLLEGVEPDSLSFVYLLNACASVRALDEGRHIHEQIIKRGWESDVFVGGSLINMYAKCGSIEEAGRVFMELSTHNLVSWNTMILGYVRCGQPNKALELGHQMQQEGMEPDHVTFMGLLNASARLGALEDGRRFHEQVIQRDWESDVFIGSSIVDMYSKCQSIDNAEKVFKRMPTRNLVSWNAMILGYVRCGQSHKALKLFQQMQLEGVEPDSISFMGFTKACATLEALEEGRAVHEQIIQRGFQSNAFVCSSLLDMYSKCGSIEDAWKVFSEMPIPSRDTVCWNTMILGCAKCGQGQNSLQLLEQMQQEGVQPDAVTFVGVLHACASVGAIEEGRSVHEEIIERGFDSDVFVGNSLMDMYSKCGSMTDAQRVFNKLPTCDVISWNTIIGGHVRCGQNQNALDLAREMLHKGVVPDPGTYVAILNACACLSALDEGKKIHEQIIISGCECDLFVGTSLVDMYSKCGSIRDAWKVFTKMQNRNIVCWNAMILGLVKCAQGRKALDLFQLMKEQGLEADPVTFVGILNACACIGAYDEGRCVHQQVIQRGFETDIFVGSSLIHMYGKCGSEEDAWRVFNKLSSPDLVAWSAMIQAYVKCGQGCRALQLARKMQQERVEPDVVTFVEILQACTDATALEEGRWIHAWIMQRGFESDVFVGTSLVNMYAKCQSMKDAWEVFSTMPTRDVVSWTSMIQGYLKCGQEREALKLCKKMQREGFDPDPLLFVSFLNACGSAEALQEGRLVHDQIIRRGCDSNLFVGSSLVDMYAKCGSCEDARRVFEKMPVHDVVSWNALIMGYVRSGQGLEALNLCRRMQGEGVEADQITYVGILNACASVAALEIGRCVHNQIVQRGFLCDVFVGNSLVDMYAKCGSIEDAQKVFNHMPSHNLVSWNTMLCGYAMHGYGKEAIKHFWQMCQKGVEIDTVTFVSLLSACNHTGLVDEGLHYFQSMDSVHQISATVEHFACIIDLLGRAGRLQEAEDLVKIVHCESNATVWMSLLNACKVYGIVEMGERVAQRVVELEPESAAGYVILSNIYTRDSQGEFAMLT